MCAYCEINLLIIEITRGIISGINRIKRAFQNKKIMFLVGNIDIKVKERLLLTYVRSVALYGNETWTIGETEEKKTPSVRVAVLREAA